MASIEIIGAADLEGARRIDPQYYQADFKENRTLVAKKTCVKFGSICATFRKGIFDVKAGVYSGAGVPFVRITNLRDGLIDDSSIVRIPEHVHAKEPKTALGAGDIVLSKTAIPAAALVTFKRCNVSQDTIAVALSEAWKRRVKSGYVVAFLNTSYGLKLLEQWFQGNIQMHLSLPDAKRIPIPLLDFDFQKVVEKLMLQADASANSARSGMLSAVARIEGEVGGWENVPSEIYSSHYSNIAINGRLDAQYYSPRMLRLRHIIQQTKAGYSSLAALVKVSDLEIDPEDRPDELIRYVELSNINPTAGLIDGVTEIMGKHAPGRARMLLKTGDVLLSSIEGSLDKAAYVDSPFNRSVGSTGFFVLKPLNTPPAFLLGLLKCSFVLEQLKREATGTILAAVPKNGLRNILIPNFPVRFAQSVAAEIELAQQKYRRTRELLAEARTLVERAIERNERFALSKLS